LKSLDFDKKYYYVTNNIAQHINKLLNNKLNCKHPTFDNWKNALIETEVEFNNKTEFISRTNYISKLLLFFIDWSSNNNSPKYLLDYDNIKKINSFLLDGTNMSSFIPLSKFFNLTDYNNSNIYNSENDSSKNKEIIDSLGNMSLSDEESSEDNNSEEINDNPKNLFDLYNSNENRDLYFNIQKFVNSYDLVELKKKFIRQ